jgi:hypothetical protein
VEKQQALENLQSEFRNLIDEANLEREEYYQLYCKENKARKAIHNKLMDIQGNIRVICRVRPVVDVERRVGQDQLVTDFPTDEDIVVTKDHSWPPVKMKFEFDRVFKPTSAQDEVFQFVQPLCVSVLDGYNVCIFAYGQTVLHKMSFLFPIIVFQIISIHFFN